MPDSATIIGECPHCRNEVEVTQVSEPGGVNDYDLLDTSIAQLRTLVAFLGDHLAEGSGRASLSASLEVRACEEVLVSLGVLIPKLQAARDAVSVRLQTTQSGSGRR